MIMDDHHELRAASTSTRAVASDGPYQVIQRPEMSTTRSSGKASGPSSTVKT